MGGSLDIKAVPIFQGDSGRTKGRGRHRFRHTVASR